MVRRSFTLFFALALLAVALAQGAPVRADEGAPSLPPYFTATSPDEAKPLWPDAVGGASGVWAAPATGADDPSKLAIPDLYDRVAHNMFSINFVWTLIAGFLVMFMQAGFALVETGLVRAKNSAHTMAMNFLVYALGMFGFFVCGFALMCGGLNGTAIGGPTSLGGVPTLNHMFTIGSAVAKLLRRVAPGLKPGAIVLLHDLKPVTLRALPQLLDRLRARHLRPVTVPELLRTDAPDYSQLMADNRGRGCVDLATARRE